MFGLARAYSTRVDVLPLPAKQAASTARPELGDASTRARCSFVNGLLGMYFLKDAKNRLSPEFGILKDSTETEDWLVRK
jgi:hypothetical protein